jgi:glycosyltransferase involved in cell wall biosynthesis
VITDQVGIHQEVSEARAGIVTPVSSEAIASALLLLLREEEMRSQMGRNASQLAASRYSIEAVAGRLIDLYVWLRQQISVPGPSSFAHARNHAPDTDF